MSQNTNVNSGISVGFTGLLTLIFITLKLCKVITWSWWWVLSPIWISFGIVIAILIIALIIFTIIAALNRK